MKEECQVLLRKGVPGSRTDCRRSHPSEQTLEAGERGRELWKAPIPEAQARILNHRGRCSKAECAASYRFDPWIRKIPLEEGMATHSSVLAWRIPWTEEPGGASVPGVIFLQ